jgi:hypothetical protein
VQFFSSYYSKPFPDLHRTLSKREQAAACHFSEEFPANPENVSANRRKEIKIQKRLVHTFAAFKSFWCPAAKKS